MVGCVLEKQGKLKEAIECYDETIKLDPAAIPLIIENIITMIRLFESYASSHLFPISSCWVARR